MSFATRLAPALRVEIVPLPGLQTAVATLAVAAAGSVWLAVQVQVQAQMRLMANESLWVGWVAGLSWWALPPLLLFSAVLAWRCARPRARVLTWDGQRWHLAESATADPKPVELRVLFDLGAWMLLWARPVGAWRSACYLPLSRRTQGSLWGPLRATLYAARRAAPADSGSA